MSRYLGPRLRKVRALDCELPGLTQKSRDNRPQPPGQHGNGRKRRGRKSDYALQLMEKQKLRFNYGLTEKQMRRLVLAAKSSRENTNNKVIELLERRLDNVVFRAGLAPTIPAARQLVTHRHFLVNGKRLDIASYRVCVGDVIEPRERSRELERIATSIAAPSLLCPTWINFDATALKATVSELPGVETIPFPVDVQLVIEYYAR